MGINALQAVLDQAQHDKAVPLSGGDRKATSPSIAKKPKDKVKSVIDEDKFYRPSRDGRKFVGGHFHPEIAKQLRMIAVEDETSLQSLLEEALEGLFIKKGKAKLAELLKSTHSAPR